MADDLRERALGAVTRILDALECGECDHRLLLVLTSAHELVQMELFEALAKAVTEPRGRDLFLRLAHEESGHFDQLHAEELAATEAVTDSLTGLYNRRALRQALGQQVAVARRYGGSLAAIMVDVANLTAINETYGQPVGDRALRTVADVLRETLRGADLVFRYGGDEFVLLLPHTDVEGAEAVAVRVEQAVLAADLRFGEEAVPLSVTAGVAVLGPDVQPASLLAAADTALRRRRSG